MATDVNICNQALIKVGAKRISALADDSKEAYLCNEFFEGAKFFVLSYYPWRCAAKRAKLESPAGSTPAFQWDYAHTLPADYLRMWLVSDINGAEEKAYEIESGELLTNLDTLYIKYTYQVTDESLLSPWVADAVSAYLAYLLGNALNPSSNDGATDFYQLFVDVAQKLSSIDARQGPRPIVFATEWLDSRLSDSSFFPAGDVRDQYPQLH